MIILQKVILYTPVLLYYVGSGVFLLRSIQFSDQVASESSKIESRLNDWPLIVTEKYQNIMQNNIHHCHASLIYKCMVCLIP